MPTQSLCPPFWTIIWVPKAPECPLEWPTALLPKFILKVDHTAGEHTPGCVLGNGYLLLGRGLGMQSGAWDGVEGNHIHVNLTLTVQGEAGVGNSKE